VRILIPSSITEGRSIQTKDVVRVFNMVPQASAAISAVPGVECVDVTAQLDETITAEVLYGGYPEWQRTMELARRGVRWVQLIGTGIDRVPPDFFKSVPIVTCARGASAVPISEYVLAVMLAFAKRFPRSWISVPPQSWNLQRLETLAGRTVGIVGFGGIGRAVATRAFAFGMDVIVVRRTETPVDLPGIEKAGTLAEMLPRLDHLVLAAPATPRTRNLLDAAMFTLVKPGLHIVNISRGALIDQEALRAALDDGRVARASLDVMTPEPLPAGHWLYTHPSVYLTPHSSWSSPRFLDASIGLFTDNLRRFLAGEPLHGIVDPAEGY
jgi:phosphoglycerate dehydrogenase-like enzyme